MFSINNRREIQQGLYNLYTRAVDRLPPNITALFIATVTGIFAVAAVSLYLYNRVTPLPPTTPPPPEPPRVRTPSPAPPPEMEQRVPTPPPEPPRVRTPSPAPHTATPTEVEQRASTPPPPEPIEPPCSAPPALTDAERLELEAQAAKIRKQNALIRNASKDTYNKRKLLSELNQQFNQLATEISDWSATYSGEIAACHKGDPRHRLCVAILRALSPTISNKELRQVTGGSPSPSESLGRLIHNPFSQLARQSRQRMNIDICWWNWKEQAHVIREISIEVRKFPTPSRTPKSSADEVSVMTYVDEEFRPFIRNMFDEIVAASRADTLANLLMRKLDLNESDRPIIEQSIEQLSRGPFDYPLLSAVRHNPFSRLRKYEWCFIPSNVCDRKDQMQRTLNSITCLRAAIDKIMEFVDPEFEPFIENTFGEVLADDLITDLDLSDSDQPRLESIVGNPSATHLAELMGILDEAEFPDYSYDPGERCPLASYLPTAQAFHRAAKSPLVQRLLVGDFQWVAFTKRSFRLAHRAMELQARLEQLSSQCNDTSRDLQNRKGINTRPFIETLQAIASETTRVQQALNERYAQLSRIIPER